MPLLADEQVALLVSNAARILDPCPVCHHHTAMDYCRTCDSFYWIHAPGCNSLWGVATAEHYGHRTYLIPFVEERGR